MKCGMRCGNPVGSVDAVNIYARIAAEEPGARTLSWTPEHDSGVVHHVFADGGKVATTAALLLANFPQDVRDHIEVFETSDQNADEDLSKFAASATDTVKLTWSEVSGAERYEVYRKVSGGSYGEPIARLRAGESSYEMLDGSLADATYVYKMVAYDAAGNSVNSNEPEAAVNAAPEPPTELSVSVD